MGFSEGAKLYYDTYKTLAVLTTGFIPVIVVLPKDLLLSEGSYQSLPWSAFFGLLVGLLAALISIELTTFGVFVLLTEEAEEIERRAEGTNNRSKWRPA